MSEPHQVGHDLAEAELFGVQVERQGRQLVDRRHGDELLAQIDRDQVPAAGLAALDGQVGQYL